MRAIHACAAWLVAMQLLAQTSWMPLSREVENLSAGHAQAHGTSLHTAIRPYRSSEVRAAMPVDTGARIALLTCPSRFCALDRWAGVYNGRKFRWGPLLDAQVVFSSDTSGSTFGHRLGAGAWFERDLGEKLTLHLDGQVWSERFPSYLDTLASATQMSAGEGYAYGDAPNYTHYDWNGYLSWDPGKYFNFTLGRGKNFFGEGHRSLLLSDEATSYPYLKVTTTVWKIKYVNLFTAMNDIRGADGQVSDFQRKWTSMHYLSWNATKWLNVALFEAVVWSQGDSLYPRGFDMNYLNPIIFYRPVEYSIGSPDNALLGGALNFRAGKSTLIYTQVMLDEFLLSEIRAGNGWYGNKQAFQLGVVSRNAFKVPGLQLRAEWNFVRPFMYTHSDTRQNYAHMGQPLAHPYGSNMQEVIAHADLSTGRWRHSLRTSMAWLGSDTTFSHGNNIFRPESDRVGGAAGFRDYGYNVGSAEPYTLLHAELRSGYLLDANTGTRVEASYLFRTRTGEGDPMQDHVFRVGLVCYFRERHPEQEVRYVLE
jgi:hypothetical protein